MSGRLDGKVIAITGAARGQGRSHAATFAAQGADIIAIDSCAPIKTTAYPMPTKEDLDHTASLVETAEQRIVTAVADVRDSAALEAALADGVATLGRLDGICANAGITTFGKLESLPDEQWDEMIDINLTGVWRTCRAAIPHLREAGGGSIVITSSVFGLKGAQNIGHYVAAKHGGIGLMRALALELAEDLIRVNCLAPGSVGTDMFLSDPVFAVYAPDIAKSERTLDAVMPRFIANNAMPIPYVDSIDVSQAALWLVSDESRYVTGTVVPIDGGRLQK